MLCFPRTTFWQHKKHGYIICGKYSNTSKILGNVSKIDKLKPAANHSLTSHNYRCPNISASDVLSKSNVDRGTPYTGEASWIQIKVVFLVPCLSSADAIVI